MWSSSIDESVVLVGSFQGASTGIGRLAMRSKSSPWQNAMDNSLGNRTSGNDRNAVSFLATLQYHTLANGICHDIGATVYLRDRRALDAQIVTCKNVVRWRLPLSCERGDGSVLMGTQNSNAVAIQRSTTMTTTRKHKGCFRQSADLLLVVTATTFQQTLV
jgi:hypothetical protein